MHRLSIFFAAVGLLLVPTHVTAQTCDLLIENGRLVDGSGNPWFQGDIAVTDGKISAIGRPLPHTGRIQIDATGLIVSPGFIDIHSHSDTLILRDGLAHSKIRQGVTTEILGEGYSAGPASGQRKPGFVAVTNDEPLRWLSWCRTARRA